MPAKSAKQERFMQAVAHDPAFAKKAGVPQKVGREFTKFAGGGIAQVEDRLKKDLENGPEAPASAPSQGKFFTTLTPAERTASEVGVAAAQAINGLDRV